jgi:hypothetical protein
MVDNVTNFSWHEIEILAYHVFLTPDIRKQKYYQLKNGGIKKFFPLAQKVTPCPQKTKYFLGEGRIFNGG